MGRTKIKNILVSMFFSALLIVPTFVVVQMVSPTHSASAAACTATTGGGGGGSLLKLETTLSTVDSSVEKLTTEFTPAQAWQDSSSSLWTAVQFAKNDCTNSGATLSMNLTGKSLSLYYTDVGHSGTFVNGTDYKNVASGVNVASSSSTISLSATYTTATVAADTAQQLSVDLGTDAGFANVYLKQGSASEALLVSIKLPTNTTSFLVKNSVAARVSYSEATFQEESCTAITGSGEVVVRVLLDGTAAALSATPYTDAPCGNFDKTSYDSGTKTATLKYDTDGETPNHTIIKGDSGFKTNSDDYASFATSLDATVSGDRYYMADNFTTSNSATQPLYVYVDNSVEGRSTTKDVPFPVVGGVVDFSGGDLDLSTGNVSVDVSAANYAALAHNFGSLTNNGTFSLFAAQREADEYVGVCPGATAIDTVNTTCGDVYFLKDGETKNGTTASLITVGVTKFWQVSGLSGTGVFSSTIGSIPGSPQSGEAKNAQMIYIAGAAILGGFAVFKAKKLINIKKRR